MRKVLVIEISKLRGSGTCIVSLGIDAGLFRDKDRSPARTACE
jgi:hypothetical protein